MFLESGADRAGQPDWLTGLPPPPFQSAYGSFRTIAGPLGFSEADISVDPMLLESGLSRLGSNRVRSAFRHRGRQPLPGARDSAWPTGIGG